VGALFEPDRHEPPQGRAWDAGVAADAIVRIAAETGAAASPEGVWPVHPDDATDGEPPAMGLYFGSAGVVWALDYLAREGAAPAGPSFAEHLPGMLASNYASHVNLGLQTRGYLVGASGILALQCKLAPSAAAAEALAAVIVENTDDPALELMWGGPGTMLAALFMHRATGEARWAELFRTGAEALERAFVFDDAAGGFLWSQDLYGMTVKFVGAVHGFAGSAYVLWVGRNLLTPEVWGRWSSRIAETLRATAIHGEAGVNWSALAPPDPKALVQHCHGAPGMITMLGLLDEPIDDLVLAAGELTWTAGPLTKGANLCHGTAGNGYAFLKLFERTGDQIWLDRARAFAMHAIAQSDAEAASIGQRRNSLWTGDPGVACYLLDCIEARARFPTLDVF
jgi:Lanthionine synthetase C-like protein